jgi:hypothetical protein
MWFKKKRVNGITLSEWVKDHIDEKKYLKVYIGKEGTYKRYESFYSTKDISYGLVEKYKNNTVNVIEILDKDNKHDETLVLIEE